MWWRVPKGGKTWEEMQGERARRSFRTLVKSGKARGVLAFDGDEPIGWCAFGPRTDFPRTERSRTYGRESLDGVWSVNCFFIPRARRGKGVASALLEAATAACWKAGARVVEGYPVPTDKEMPGAFVWRGTLNMFLKRGYRIAKREAPARPLVEATR